MQAHKKLLILVIMLVGLSSVGFTQETAQPPDKDSDTPTDNTATAAVPSFPYVAEITEDDIPVRSGPGTNYYICGKLKKSDKVNVVGSQFSWSRIVPPAGSFSWISNRYISIDPDNPAVGIVTADGIRVYAGSEYKEPIHSETLQLKLNRGDEVRFVGAQKGDYYKIAPPQGAFLWVSSQFLQSTEKPAAKPPVPDANAVARSSTAKRPIDPNAGPLTGLDLYYALSDLVKAERAKPLSGQNYAEIKKKLAGLAATKDGGRAARYAEYTLKQVERYEMACTAAKELELQNREKQKINEKIDAARATKLAQVDDRSKFAIVGKLETSSVYVGPTRRYRILDDTGKTVCYVTPTGPAVKTDFSKLIGHKVGLVGKIEAHESTSRPFIEFIEIVLLD